jgi:hypothetical protein
MHTTPSWTGWAVFSVSLFFAWILLRFLYDNIVEPIAGRIRWRLKVRRYWRNWERQRHG